LRVEVISLAVRKPFSLIEALRRFHILSRIQVQPVIAYLVRILLECPQQQIREALSAMRRPYVEPLDFSATRLFLYPAQRHATGDVALDFCQPHSCSRPEIFFREFLPVFA